MCGWLSCTSSWGPGPRNPGMCPDWESNQRLFGLQASTQSTEPHQPGLGHLYLNFNSTSCVHKGKSQFLWGLEILYNLEDLFNIENTKLGSESWTGLCK